MPAHVDAAARPAAGAVGLVEPLAVEVFLPEQVADAYSAVHTAGGNQFLVHGLILYRSVWLKG
jgi:hypothetical protein